jgi:phytoene synthase
MEMDLELNRYPDYDALEAYCYRAASAVGLLSIEIFGYQDGACQHYAIHLGKALQLTNILRDIANDAQRGRIYLPMCELARFKVEPDEILERHYSERFRDLASSVAERAAFHYAQAKRVLPHCDRRSMATAELMGCVYWRLLQKIAHYQYDIFNRPKIRLGGLEKLNLISRTGLALITGIGFPRYAP